MYKASGAYSSDCADGGLSAGTEGQFGPLIASQQLCSFVVLSVKR